MIKLSDRLQKVYDMIPPCSCLADVGCDHGYLTIAALENNRASSAIAMDVNPGPLAVARENVARQGLMDRCQFCLSDGLEALKPGQAQVICICGMGGILMERILTAGLDKARDCDRLILEPQSEIRAFRSFLMAQGFVIDDEDLVMEENKIYPIMSVHYEAQQGLRGSYSLAELTYGPVIIKKRPPLLDRLLEKNQAEYSRILEGLKQHSFEDNSPAALRVRELDQELALIRDLKELLGQG